MPRATFRSSIAYSSAGRRSIHRPSSPRSPHCSRSYGLAEVTGDKYAAEWVVEALGKNSSSIAAAIVTDPRCISTRSPCSLPAAPGSSTTHVLVHQFSSLERRTSRTGRDRVDHPAGSHDDLANAAAGALILASGKSGQLVISDQTLMRSRIPLGGYNFPFYLPGQYNDAPRHLPQAPPEHSRRTRRVPGVPLQAASPRPITNAPKRSCTKRSITKRNHEMSNLLLRAIKRRFSTPEAAMTASA